MRLAHVAEYATVRVGCAMFTALPYERSLAIGKRLGRWLGARVSRRHDVMENLLRAFPHHTQEQRHTLARDHFEHLGVSAVEFAWLSAGRSRVILDRLTIDGASHFHEAKQMGKGVIILTFHLGNWEIFGAAIPTLEANFSTIVFPQTNPLTDAFIDRVRRQHGVRTVRTGFSTREAYVTLQQGGTVGILADQDAGGGGVFVNLFGHPASTAKGPVLLSLRTGAPVIAAFTVREPGDTHRLIITPPFHWARSGDEAHDVVAGTQQWTNRLEEWILQYPAQWFWVHRRWKSRPIGRGSTEAARPEDRRPPDAVKAGRE